MYCVVCPHESKASAPHGATVTGSGKWPDMGGFGKTNLAILQEKSVFLNIGPTPQP